MQQIPLFYFTTHLLLVKPASKNSQHLQLYSQSCRSKVTEHFTSEERLAHHELVFSNTHFQQKYWFKSTFDLDPPSKKSTFTSLISLFIFYICLAPVTQPCLSPPLDLSCEKENISLIPVHQTTTGTASDDGKAGGKLGCWMIFTGQMPPLPSLPTAHHLNEPW